jgi:succinyl-CoA synthetase beta subunit
MARLHEHEGKALFKIAKMPIPQGDVAGTPEEARKIAEKIGKPVVIKVQIWAGGRGKAGGVKFADTPAEAEKMAAALLGMTKRSWISTRSTTPGSSSTPRRMRAARWSCSLRRAEWTSSRFPPTRSP